MIETSTYKFCQDSSAAGSCAYYHEMGKHDSSKCPLPEGYCAVIGHLIRTHAEEKKLAADKLALVRQYVPMGSGGSGSSNSVGGGGAGGDGGYYKAWNTGGSIT